MVVVSEGAAGLSHGRGSVRGRVAGRGCRAGGRRGGPGAARQEEGTARG